MEKDFIIENGVLIRYEGSSPRVVIPEGVTEIDRCVFMDGRFLESVILPSTLRRIDEEAFMNCFRLTEAVLPEGLEYIGRKAFMYCFGISDLIIHEKAELVEEQAFYGCMGLKNVKLLIPAEGLIDDIFMFSPIENLYAPLVNLSQIRHPDLRRAAVKGFCTNVLRGKQIPEEIRTQYRKYIKSQRRRLYDLGLKNPQITMYMAAEKLIPKMEIQFVINMNRGGDPEALAALLNYEREILTDEDREAKFEADMNIALTGEISLKDAKNLWGFMNLEDGTLRIKSYKGDEEDVFVPHIIGNKVVSEIGLKAFSPKAGYIMESDRANRRRIKSIHISEDVKIIGERAFDSCESLADLFLPESVTEIGRSAFRLCTNLTVHGKKNSEAHKICRKKHVLFEEE